jgi:hypothetical protein
MNEMDHLGERLHELADVSPSTAPTGRLLERGRRARHRRAALTSASLAVVALGAITGVVVSTQDTAPERPAATASAADPRMHLAAAITKSENISYRIHVTLGGGPFASCDGAFDPNTATGYMRFPQDDSVMTELLINGTRYIGGEPPLTPLPADKGPEHEKYGRYGQYPGKFDRLSICSDSDGVLGAAAPDPAALFEALKAANATVTDKPDGGVHFAYTKQTDGGLSTTATSGDITFDADGRIATVTMAIEWQSTVKHRNDSGAFTVALPLSDYGLQVKVKRPKDVVPAN